METKIQVLPEELCNKIAAGEVVERPSSVVKELLENSLDAGASDILIELEAGGKRLIRITDNGCGMDRQDAFLSFERHATSKIRTDADLFALTTLGFRGEALASIASVSRLRLKTCDNDEGLGQQIYAEGGKIKNVDELGLPQGAVVEVRNLFFNLPARKKFLRKEQTELGHAADVVTKQALANPGVSFRLKHNDRMMLDLRREKGLRERVAALLGRSLLHDLLPLERQHGADLQLSGLISQPQLTRSATSHIYTFINGRYIRDRVVQHAVMDGYRHLLMKGRYPVVVLFLQIDPAQVDVNVHPTKHEVRFREQSLVHDFIATSLQQTLRPAEWLEKEILDSSANKVENYLAERHNHRSEHDSLTSADSSVQESSAQYVPPGERFQENHIGREPTAQQFYPSPSSYQPSSDDQSVIGTQYILPGSEETGFFSRLQILGQYHQSYLLCQDGADLIMIDQHAAHERVGFEKLRHAYAAGAIPSQTLLFPEVLELDFNSAAALGDNQRELESLGFEIEPFGGKSFALKAVPQLLENRDVVRLVVDVALELERIGRTGQLRESIDEILILMACHSVIRANQALAVVEIKALFQDLDQIDFKANCPHGRPVMQRMTLTEVERMFRRQ
ncbi:MAG: DNA mismatch repair endonuclease MutL [Thermodesulfobacteriota bacterium]|nr:DNA mismatch repair endonuclease MutL [Thermodesulfobacteriota bacterium]